MGAPAGRREPELRGRARPIVARGVEEALARALVGGERLLPPGAVVGREARDPRDPTHVLVGARARCAGDVEGVRGAPGLEEELHPSSGHARARPEERAAPLAERHRAGDLVYARFGARDRGERAAAIAPLGERLAPAFLGARFVVLRHARCSREERVVGGERGPRVVRRERDSTVEIESEEHQERLRLRDLPPRFRDERARPLGRPILQPRPRLVQKCVRARDRVEARRPVRFGGQLEARQRIVGVRARARAVASQERGPAEARVERRAGACGHRRAVRLVEPDELRERLVETTRLEDGGCAAQLRGDLELLEARPLRVRARLFERREPSCRIPRDDREPSLLGRGQDRPIRVSAGPRFHPCDRLVRRGEVARHLDEDERARRLVVGRGGELAAPRMQIRGAREQLRGPRGVTPGARRARPKARHRRIERGARVGRAAREDPERLVSLPRTVRRARLFEPGGIGRTVRERHSEMSRRTVDRRAYVEVRRPRRYVQRDERTVRVDPGARRVRRQDRAQEPGRQRDMEHQRGAESADRARDDVSAPGDLDPTQDRLGDRLLGALLAPARERGRAGEHQEGEAKP